MSEPECIFCNIPESDVVFENPLAVAVHDRYPVSQGHMLIIPRRHVQNYFNVSDDEAAAIHDLLQQCRVYLGREFQPDGYNIGVNIGETGGQSVFHVHVHLIPRFAGDHPHPRGGIRNVIPGKGDYP